MRKGFMLPAALLLVPLCLMLTFSLVRLVTTGAGFGLQAQQKIKAFYVAEAGLNCGFHLFGLANFTGVTHQSDGSVAEDEDSLFLPENLALVRDSDGWIAWRYDPDTDPVESSFTRSGLEESYRFRVWFPDPGQPSEWRIDCEAVVGNRRAVHHMAGILEDPQRCLIFDNGDLADLARSSQQRLEGEIHTNGNLFLAPWKTNGFGLGGHFIVAPSTDALGANLTDLSLANANITTGEDLIRREDFWGRSEAGVTVSVNGVSLGSSDADYYDSRSPEWNSPGPEGALAVFGGRVKTRDVGARQRNLPHSTVFEPGGYYDQKAGLRIEASSAPEPWLSKVETYNEAEKQRVRVTEIDLAALAASGQWPANGLLYSSTPLRIVNGANLEGPLTVVCSETVYLQGDFNKRYRSAADQASDSRREQPAAIMTADRIYKLSDQFVDQTESSYVFPLSDPDLFIHGLREDGTRFRPATDPPKFAGDPSNVIEHNVVMVDSAPTEDTAAFAFADRGHPSSYNPDLKVRLTQDPVTHQVEFVFPSSEDFLENVSGLRFEHSGSQIHLRNATMVSGAYGGMFNEEYWSAPHVSKLREGPGPTPYILRSAYIPPSAYWHTGPENETPGLFRSSNDMAAGLAGHSLPFALRSARRTFWSAE
jgi:hypothetical protein